MFHNVSALLFALTVKQGNARLSASLSGTLEMTQVEPSFTDKQRIKNAKKWRSLNSSCGLYPLCHCTLVLTTVGGRKNMQNCTESCLR